MSIAKEKSGLFLATNNPGKIREFRFLFAPLKIITPGEQGFNFRVNESGEDYWMNAKLKALAGFKLTGLPTIADDSGLEIKALDGYPGVYSARFFSIDGVLKKLEGMSGEKRKAWFIAVIAFAYMGEVEFFEGILEGFIADSPRGERGFGYDPIFYLPEYSKTVAELDPAIKNKISHRAKAAKKAKEFILRRYSLHKKS